ncbi:uncharacterized protein Bfra_001279 [Botrytis fragariae]|uniref:Uncharacterized protein n=1 Tax=Botrytis fragariae TaxID=1964551 RepID=A0A8H6B085_9HELO|nr:uncharacterized protein Bfra_001279 [Botrytis fragariae]KAF5876921.1 hypothetical protein Bfra_001279 [Botrytis fragariae]
MFIDWFIPTALMTSMLVMFLAGWAGAQEFGHAKQDRQMRARVLNEILEAPPEKRTERILELCFFVIADNESTRCQLENNVLPEVYEHLEKQMRRNEMDGGRFWDVLGVGKWMGYEKQISRVQGRIEEFKERKREEKGLEGGISKDTQESGKEGAGCEDLERGV